MRLKIGISGLAAVALLAAACDDGDSELDAALETLGGQDLAALVLPIEELGEIGEGFSLDPESGEQDNAAAAENSIDPDDTADDVEEAGRVAGYTADYLDFEAEDEGDAFIITSAVSLFEAPGDASEALRKAVGDFEDAEGETRDGQTVDEVEAFDVDAGDEARGLVVAMNLEGVGEVRATAAYGRVGRLGFTMGILTLGDEAREDDARRLAERHEEWIRDVLTGDAGVAPMSISSPGAGDGAASIEGAPPLDDLALQLDDLPAGFIETGAGFETADPSGQFDYTRSFEAQEDYVEVGENSSRAISIENNVIVFETAVEARTFIAAVSALLEGDDGAEFLRTLIEQEGVAVEDLSLEQRELDLGDETVVVEARATTVEAGDIMLEFLMSRQGRVVSVFIVTGEAEDFDPRDIRPLAETVFGRLSDAGIE